MSVRVNSPGPIRFDETAITSSILRVIRDGVTSGTAFLISSDGTAVTCAHVVDGIQDAVVEFADGTQMMAHVDIAPTSSVDAALLRLQRDTPSVSVSTLVRSQRYWTKGFNAVSASLGSAFPDSGTVQGSTRLTYGPDARYEVREPLVLKGGSFGHGLSGAPLIDPEWGVATGIVNARFDIDGQPRGFAITFAELVEGFPAFAEVMARQDENPLYGPYLNRQGVHALTDAQVLRAVDRLGSSHGLVLDRRIERAGLTEAIDLFLDSRERVLPLLGLSGVGKTTEVAAQASRVALTRPTMLLTGQDIRQDDRELSAVTDRLLATESLLGGAPDFGSFTKVLAGTGPGMVVFLDALNETPARFQEVAPNWIAWTVNWLRDNDVRLIVSCRPEAWEGFAAHFGFGPQANLDETSRRAQVTLGEFTGSEAAAALSAYGLTQRGLRPAELRHPLLIRLLWLLSKAQAPVSGLGIYDGIRRFVEFKAERVAETTHAHRMRVQQAIATAASAIPLRGGLAASAYYAAFAAEPEMADGLLNEHLLVERSGGVDFVFDQVGEFLRAQSLDLNDSFALAKRPDDDWAEIGSVAFAILRAESEGGSRWPALIKELVDLLQQPILAPVDWAIAQAIADLKEPSAVVEIIRQFVLTLRNSVGLMHDLPARAIRMSSLELSEKFSLLFILAAHAHYEFESANWDSLEAYLSGGPISELKYLSELTREQPQDAFRALAGLLYSSDATGGAQVSNAEMARALLFAYRELDLAGMCEVVAERIDDTRRALLSPAYEFLTELARRRPGEVVEVARDWLRSQDHVHIAVGVGMIGNALRTHKDMPDRDGLVELLRGVWSQSHDDLIRRLTTRALLDSGVRDAELLDVVIPAFLSDDIQFSGLDVLQLRDFDPDRAYKAIEDYVQSGRPYWRVPLMADLGALAGDDAKRAVEILERVVGDGHLEDVEIAVSAMLVHTISSSLGRRLEVLAHALIRSGSPGQRRQLLRSAVGVRMDRPRMRQERLLRAVVDQASLEDLVTVVAEILKRKDRSGWAVSTAMHVGRPLPPIVLLYQLLDAARVSQPMAEATWDALCKEQELGAPVGRIAMFCELVEVEHDPLEVADELLTSELLVWPRSLDEVRPT